LPVFLFIEYTAEKKTGHGQTHEPVCCLSVLLMQHAVSECNFAFCCSRVLHGFVRGGCKQYIGG
jgi:hypothetical protein